MQRPGKGELKNPSVTTVDENTNGTSTKHSVMAQALLDWDKDLTKQLSIYSSPNDPATKSIRLKLKALEISCHGVPCLAINTVLLWFLTEPTQLQFLLNVLLALILDIICVALLKAILRRRRPSNNHNDMFATISVDKYSCPSGHASRAITLALIFVCKGELFFLLDIFILAWAVSVCVSRVLLGRHHVGDVICGALLGIFQYYLMMLIWLDVETSQSVLKFVKGFESFHTID